MFNALLTSAGTPSGMAEILEDSTTVYTSVLEWVGSTLDVIVSEPLLMVTFCLGLGATAIGIISRLIRR